MRYFWSRAMAAHTRHGTVATATAVRFQAGFGSGEHARRQAIRNSLLRSGHRAPEKVEHAAIHQQKGAADHECSQDLLQ